MKDLKMNVIYVKTNQLPFSYPSSADQSAAFSFLGIRKRFNKRENLMRVE